MTEQELIGLQLGAERKKKKLTQKDIFVKSGIPIRTIKAIEKGSLSIESLAKYLEALEIESISKYIEKAP